MLVAACSVPLSHVKVLQACCLDHVDRIVAINSRVEHSEPNFLLAAVSRLRARFAVFAVKVRRPFAARER